MRILMKKDYVFNTIAGLIDASEAVIISMIITRTTGLTDAGYVTIAFAVGILLNLFDVLQYRCP